MSEPWDLMSPKETYWVEVVHIGGQHERVKSFIDLSELNSVLNQYDDSRIYERIFYGRN
jgi:hypothetical protein